jgi:hypothetical protein
MVANIQLGSLCCDVRPPGFSDVVEPGFCMAKVGVPLVPPNKKVTLVTTRTNKDAVFARLPSAL